MIDTSGFNFETGEWNDSLSGDFVWGNANIGEALSFVVTPFSWSVIGAAYDHISVLPGYHSAGNIGGRPYQNGTAMASALEALGKDVDALFREMGGQELPAELTVPLIAVPWWAKVAILYKGLRLRLREWAALRGLPRFLAENPGWCAEMQGRARSAGSGEELAGLWSEIEAHGIDAFWFVVAATWRYAGVVANLRRQLISLVGAADADIMLSGVSSETELLASLGPVVGLSRVARGEMTRREYLMRYGHRGPYEAEFAAPRPAEDPTWLDRQLDLLGDSAAGAEEMLARQRSASEVAWERFRLRYPDEADATRRRLETAAELSRAREAARSEMTRQVWAGRAWGLRAGELSGQGDDVFHLIVAEVLDLLLGKPVPVETIPTRKETHARYRTLPPYPPLISGHFDPFAWAADPDRRNDFFDSHAASLPAEREAGAAQVVKGVPGSAGSVEGLVRRIDSPEEADQLRPGEILVTSQTNVGWTLLFPKAAAVVTDVGAPLSHAAIVARELGIPAVVGCGDATTRLKTGDRVRVNGATGLVELMAADGEGAPSKCGCSSI